MARENLHVRGGHVTACAMRLLADLRACKGVLPGFALIGVYWSGLFAQMPVLRAQVNLTDGGLGTVMLCAVSGAMLSMLSTPLIMRYLGAWTGRIGAFGLATGFWTLSAADTVPLFALGLFIGGLGTGLLDVVINAEVSRIEIEHGTPLMNLNHGVFSATYALFAVLIGAARASGWAPWQVFAGLFLLSLVYIWLMRVGSGADPKSDGSKVPLPGLLIFAGGLVVMIAFMGEAASEGWSAIYIERQLSGSPTDGALGPALLGLSMAIGRIGGHFIRLSPLPFMAAGLALAMIGLAIVSGAGSINMALFGFFLGGLGVSVVGPLALALVGQGVPEADRLRAMSCAVAMGSGALFLGPPLMGFISEAFGLATSFAVMAGALGLVLITALPLLARANFIQ